MSGADHFRRIIMEGMLEMKKKVNANDYAELIANALGRGGILLNTNGEKFNTMVIGWGALGRCWNLPVFTVYVRENRFTKSQLDKTGEFTLSIPLEGPDRDINKICGLQSGRNIDKVKEAGLILEEPEIVSVSGIRQYPLTLECRVLYAQKQELSLLPEEIVKNMYPQDVDGTAPMANRDAHTAYIGQVVAAYIIE